MTARSGRDWRSLGSCSGTRIWIGAPAITLALVLVGLPPTCAFGVDEDWEGLSAPIVVGGGTEALFARYQQIDPVVAYDSTAGEQGLAIWQDDRAGDPDIFGARFNLEGEVLDPRSIPIATGAAAQTISFDFGTVDESDGLSQNAGTFALRFQSQDGFGIGELIGLDFTEEGFVEMSRRVMDIAGRHAQGRLISVLEGGYDLQSLSRSVDAHLKTLMSSS